MTRLFVFVNVMKISEKLDYMYDTQFKGVSLSDNESSDKNNICISFFLK